MTLAWDMDIPSTEKMVLLCLCDYADDNGGSCYPAISTLAKRTSKNTRTVQRALRWLQSNNICVGSERAGNSTNYTINLDGFVRGDSLSGVTPRHRGGDTTPPRGVTNTTQRGDTTPPNPLRTTKGTTKGTTIAKKLFLPVGVDELVWNDFLAIRKAKRSPMSETALAGIEREAKKAGLTLNEALTECTARGWQGFKADWVRGNPKMLASNGWELPIA
jgi:Helix-turn-helix domain